MHLTRVHLHFGNVNCPFTPIWCNFAQHACMIKCLLNHFQFSFFIFSLFLFLI